MSTVITSRLCWNCEGDVETESESCPYCGVDLGGDVRAPRETSQEFAPAPAYQPVNSEEENSIPEPAYHVNESRPSAISDERWNSALNNAPAKEKMKAQVDDARNWLSPLVMLLTGSVFFLFGFVLFLFGEDGVFTLRWNANFSILYLVGAVPLLYYGWQSLQKLEE